MAAVADAEADRLLDGRRSRALPTRSSPSPTRCRSPTATFDGALSSFVFQLVPSRARALREARRVCGRAGCWPTSPGSRTSASFAPDAIFDDVLDDVGFDARDGDGRSGRPPVGRARRRRSCAAPASRTSPRAAGMLEHRFTVDGYIAFLTEFDEETLFAELEPDVRERLVRRRSASAWARCRPEQMTMRFPIVFATGPPLAR